MHDSLQALVHDQVKCRLDGAKVASAESLVQTRQALMAKHLPHTVETVLVSAVTGGRLGLVQLQPCLDKPDRIGGSCCGYSGRDGRLCMDECRVFPVPQDMGADALAVAINIKFDGGRRDHTGKTRTQTSEECSPAFGAIDVAHYSGGLVACAESMVGC